MLRHLVPVESSRATAAIELRAFLSLQVTSSDYITARALFEIADLAEQLRVPSFTRHFPSPLRLVKGLACETSHHFGPATPKYGFYKWKHSSPREASPLRRLVSSTLLVPLPQKSATEVPMLGPSSRWGANDAEGILPKKSSSSTPPPMSCRSFLRSEAEVLLMCSSKHRRAQMAKCWRLPPPRTLARVSDYAPNPSPNDPVPTAIGEFVRSLD